MHNKFLFSVLILLTLGSSVYAAPKKHKGNPNNAIADSLVMKNRDYIGIGLSRINSSAYYGEDGTQYADVIGMIDADHDSVYTWTRTSYEFPLSISKSIIKKPDYDIFARGGIVLAHNDIKKKWASVGKNSDSVGSYNLVYSNTKFPSYSLGLGADYKYKNFYFTLGGDYSGSIIGTDTAGNAAEIFDIYYSSFKPYLLAAYRGSKSFFELGGSYTAYSNSPLSNAWTLHFGIGIVSVPQTAFGAYVEYTKSKDKIDMNAHPFEPLDYQIAEEYTRVGVYLNVLVEKYFLPSLSYELNLAGKDTPQMGIFRAEVKMLFDIFKER